MPEDPNQPAQIDFENNVSIAFLKVLDQYASASTPQEMRQIFIEDEGRRIGNVSLPPVLNNRMKENDGIVIIEDGMEERLDVLVEDYVVDLRERFVKIRGEELGLKAHSEALLGGLTRIRKKLGGDRYADLTRTMTTAIAEQNERNDLTLHRVWIKDLLDSYYDPSYDFALSQRNCQVIFRGDRESVVEWATDSNKIK